ncbi:hypothetical protein FDECE_17967 [Fusarium decemcellulare]|nr:hypothetical protein FDECE_17967 [Fusarium decemcellulare]
MPAQTSNQSSGKQSSTTSASSSNAKPPTRYSVVRDGWGSRPQFQASYGLRMDPDGIEEGNAILDAMIQNDPTVSQK